MEVADGFGAEGEFYAEFVCRAGAEAEEGKRRGCDSAGSGDACIDEGKKAVTTSLFLRSSVVFSPCERYRYVLERIWGDGGRLANFCMLNPSKATAEISDPTVTRQMERARLWGYDGIVVTNAHAWRSTDPAALLEVEDPTGPDNDRHIVEQAKRCEVVVCGWGSHKAAKERGPEVLRMLRAAGVKPMALRVTNGVPWHPLYIGYSAGLVEVPV